MHSVFCQLIILEANLPFIGELAAIMGALLWSLVSFVFTSLQAKIGSLQMNIDRMLVAAILMLATILLIGISLSITTTQFTLLFVSGIIGLVIGDGALFLAFREIGPRITHLIMSFNPGIAAVVAYFTMGEILPAIAIGGMALTLTGISVVILEKPKAYSKYKITLKGIIFSIIGASGQAVGLVLTKLAFNAGDLHEFTATFYRLFAGVLFMLPICAAIKRYKNPIKLYIKMRKEFWLVILAAIIGPYLGITFSFIAISHTQIGIASTLLATSPIMMVPLSRIIYKEKISFKSVIGACLAVGGVILLFM